MGLIHNKLATRNFDVLETHEAGIELFGFEVKSVRGKQGSLRGAYITIGPDGAWLMKASIPPFQSNNTPAGYDPERPRRLLLGKKELRELAQKLESAGLTLIPVSLYNRGGFVKVEVALARGKKKYDKREAIKKRDQERDAERMIKRSVRF
jgi:SsrA-binding protein